MDGVRIAINGFGRIGRVAFRQWLKEREKHPDLGKIQVVAINDLTQPRALAHLLKYDSVHGVLPETVEAGESSITVGEEQIPVHAKSNPADLPWEDLEVDLVLECTGVFKTYEKAKEHLNAGAKKVVISAPASGDEVKSIVLGVNEGELSPEDVIVSNASCTTNCLAPMIKVLDENWGVEHGYVTTVHAYTADQQLQDAPHPKDLRRSRAAAENIVPTSTGAAAAISQIFPELEGRLDGMAMRVPVVDGSITDLSCTLKEIPTSHGVNEVFRSLAEGELKGILEVNDDPIVSSDIVGNPHSCIIDSLSTRMLQRTVKLVGWYDNETGYARRLIELAGKMGSM